MAIRHDIRLARQPTLLVMAKHPDHRKGQRLDSHFGRLAAAAARPARIRLVMPFRNRGPAPAGDPADMRVPDTGRLH